DVGCSVTSWTRVRSEKTAAPDCACKECYVKVASTHRRYIVSLSFQLNFPGMVWIRPHGRRLCGISKAYAGKEGTRRPASQEESVLQQAMESDDPRGHARRPAGHDVFQDRSHMAGPDQRKEF